MAILKRTKKIGRALLAVVSITILNAHGGFHVSHHTLCQRNIHGINILITSVHREGKTLEYEQVKGEDYKISTRSRQTAYESEKNDSEDFWKTLKLGYMYRVTPEKKSGCQSENAPAKSSAIECSFLSYSTTSRTRPRMTQTNN